MTNVVDISERLQQYDGQVCPDCGGAWFRVDAVAIGPDGNVTAYTHPVLCASCNKPRSA